MPTALDLVVELAFFSFGALLIARLVVDWLLRTEGNLARVRQHALADPVGQVEREAIRTCLFALAAAAAWRWADLSGLWLVATAVLGVSGLSGLYLAHRIGNSPELSDQRRSTMAKVEVDRVVPRTRLVGFAVVSLSLALWIYSWRHPLAELWRLFAPGAAL